VCSFRPEPSSPAVQLYGPTKHQTRGIRNHLDSQSSARACICCATLRQALLPVHDDIPQHPTTANAAPSTSQSLLADRQRPRRQTPLKTKYPRSRSSRSCQQTLRLSCARCIAKIGRQHSPDTQPCALQQLMPERELTYLVAHSRLRLPQPPRRQAPMALQR
jgi:hypothetical protein